MPSRLRGKAILVRCADDAAILFENETDAHRMMEVLPKRFGKYGLVLHPEKTRIVPFQRPDRLQNRSDDEGGPEGPGTFDFLGFTTLWGKSRAGKWVVLQRIAKDRFRRAMERANDWCKRFRHAPVEEQHKALNRKLRGHYGYYRRVGNGKRLWEFLYRVTEIWKRWLSKRSQRPFTWIRMNRLLKRFPLLTPSRVYNA